MRTSFLFALVALFGLSMAMSLPEDRRAQNLYKVLQARTLKGEGNGKTLGQGKPCRDKKGKHGGDSSDSSDEDDVDNEEVQKYRQFQSMLAFGSLTSKCEMLVYYLYGEIAESGAIYEEALDDAAEYAPTLVAACPHVKAFYYFFQNATEDKREKMVRAMAPYGLLLQCINLFADLDTLNVFGFTNTSDDGTPESQLLVHGESLMEGCINVFGEVADEETKVEEDLDDVEAAAADEKTAEVRSLLKQLEQLLRSK